MRSISDYELPASPGIQVITNQGVDLYGGFATIPVINGYQYDHALLLGSTSVSSGGFNTNPNIPGDGQNGNQPGRNGGYIRGVSYTMIVPAGPVTEPYTMTYAYAMVLQDGRHDNNEQALISATLKTDDGIISCASPSYYLPTFGVSGGEGNDAEIDTLTAIANGFTNSNQPSPNIDRRSGEYLLNIWTKAWTEVTFDLSPYRGKRITLTFEADNCVPGGHFAYAYIALRNTCAGLAISGNKTVCSNSSQVFSIPALGGATYEWEVPGSWTIISGTSTNIINVKTGQQGGQVIVREKNSCADLRDTIQVVTLNPPIGGNMNGNATVCAGSNSSSLSLTGYSGNIINWIASTDGINWNTIPITSAAYTAQNLTATTRFKALVQTTTVCPADSSSSAIVTVDQQTIGGILNPVNSNICEGQNRDNILTLSGYRGNILQWQYSQNSINWTDINPAHHEAVYQVTGLESSTRYRTIVKNGVCPATNSSIASIQLFQASFPAATIEPAIASICYGEKIALSATVNTGTRYSWINGESLNIPPNGIIPTTPFTLRGEASPSATTDYILRIENAGCPNALTDTFHITVVAPFTISAGRDTAVVAGQPLQLLALSNDATRNYDFKWSPPNYLNNGNIASPIATFPPGANTITYTILAKDAAGCTATASLHIKIYNIPPGIYVPTAFTPNSDGLNDNFKLIVPGIKTLLQFRVYNRWGMLVFTSVDPAKGWDGSYKGTPQETGNYVWIAEGITYEGKSIQTKGNVMLIR